MRRPELDPGHRDHNNPTDDVLRTITDPARGRADRPHSSATAGISASSCTRLGDSSRGIAHVIGPELGLTQPGMTLVCCDSHTSTHGAFGVLAFGIGTSQVEHVLATQTLPMTPMKNMRVVVDGQLPAGATAKDLILAIIAQIGTAGGQGHVIEYQGEAIRALSMEGRMTVCNMSIEAGARAGLIAPDEVTVEYLRGRPHVPSGAAFDEEVEYWRTFYSDDDAEFDKEVHLDAATIAPAGVLGYQPCPVGSARRRGARPDSFVDPVDRAAAERALTYMDLTPGHAAARRSRSMPCSSDRAPTAGSRTCGKWPRCGRADASHPVSTSSSFPGRKPSAPRPIDEGLDEIFAAAGAPLRYSGCSMCVALNDDRLRPGQRAASTNNRNFEGRQGRGVTTHLVSPAVAAATAITGRLTAPADLED